ncbi:hypothetical protein B9Z55_002755 [Caenorhabditis nigoni]|nr:hypothetical protein B9Z55_002755 [Caenorhabditis nigoni]
MSKSTKITPKGIECVRVNGVYEWQFYGGTVTDMAFAIQETQCGCSNPMSPTGQPTKVYGTCDIYKVTCKKGEFPIVQTQTISAMGSLQSSSLIFSDLTCVSKQWYYNNMEVKSAFGSIPQVFCTGVESSVIGRRSGTFKFKYHCGCREIEEMTSAYAPVGVYNFYKATTYASLAYRNGLMSYNDVACTASISCTGSDALILFSGNRAPKRYAPGVAPHIECHESTARPLPDQTPETKKQWYIDGIMMNMPAFSCLQDKGCSCKYVPLTSANIQKLVGSYSFYPYIGTRTIRTPTDNRPASLICPTEITCPPISLLSFLILSTLLCSQKAKSLSNVQQIQENGQWTTLWIYQPLM